MTSTKQQTKDIELERCLRAAEFSRLLGIGESTLWAWVAEGRIKRGHKLSSRTTVWRASVVKATIDALVPAE